MRRIFWVPLALSAVFWPITLPDAARGEDLADAWAIALGVDPALRSRQLQSLSAGLEVRAARAAYLPTVSSSTYDVFLTHTPTIRQAVPSGSAATPGFAGIALLGRNQTNVPVSITTANLSLYGGGRTRANVDAAGHQLNSRKAQESRGALDLKLRVAEAYVGVLRAREGLAVARSNVAQLGSFLGDVNSRQTEGLATRNEALAAEVSLSRGRQDEVRARARLGTAWATYNRYLCRPLDSVVELDELVARRSGEDAREAAALAVKAQADFVSLDEGEVADLTRKALGGRPELVELAEQARSQAAQAEATRAGTRPQVGLIGGYNYLGANSFSPQNYGFAAFTLDWTLFDGRAARRRAESLNAQERATLMQRQDQAAQIALDVRTQWLEWRQAQVRAAEARVAVTQAEENNRVTTDRYRQGLATYTEVLDAETRRVRSMNDFSDAAYDELVALFRLRRAVGDI